MSLRDFRKFIIIIIIIIIYLSEELVLIFEYVARATILGN